MYNDRLRQLYESKWDQLWSNLNPLFQIPNNEPANPLLLNVNNEEVYKSADLRIMIFGQETNGWHEEACDDEIRMLCKAYNEYFNFEECYSKGRPFWNGFTRFFDLFRYKYPSINVVAVWNNVVKIGKRQGMGFPPANIYQIEREYFNVINEEIKILHPEILLFLSGPYYDHVIKSVFGNLRYEPISPFKERQLARVYMDGVDHAYRTYHPNYLWRNNINKYYNAILEDLKF